MTEQKPVKKRHHAQPEFYLRGFCQPGADRVWVYDFEATEPRCVGVENASVERYRYSVTRKDGSRDNSLEDWIADTESKAAPILKKLIAGDNISLQERADFASFMALMHVRTDSARELYAQMIAGRMQIEAYATAKHDRAFMQLMEGFQKQHGTMTAEKIEQVRQALIDPKGFVISVNKEATLSALIAHDDFLPIFLEMEWSVVISKEPYYFVTSDNPLSHHVHEKHRNPMVPSGFLHPKAEVSLPLSSSACLIATRHRTIPARSAAKPEFTKTMNRERAVFARRYLYGPRLDPGVKRLAEKYKTLKPGFKFSGFGPKEFSTVKLKR